MTVPAAIEYAPDVFIAVNTAFRDLLDDGGGNAYILICNADGWSLARIELDNPSGTVDPITGQLSLTGPGGDTAWQSGTAAYAELYSADDLLCCRMPAIAGDTPTPGYITINTGIIFANEPVSLISAVIG